MTCIAYVTKRELQFVVSEQFSENKIAIPCSIFVLAPCKPFLWLHMMEFAEIGIRNLCDCLLSLATLVFRSGGNSEIYAHARSNIYCLICLRHLITSGTVTNQIFSLRKDLFSLGRKENGRSEK